MTLPAKITAGLISGATAAAIFTPTDVLKIRLQADVTGTRYTGLMNALQTIYKMEGLRNGLYKGVGITILRSALLTSAQLASYDHSKHTLITQYGAKDQFLTHFWYFNLKS
eukprot:TRINITY_DN3514_c2_g1_i7.p1 TRINITY_DN3514_c2_g1~~TRINITY_DN3514_c2_g1_i7.p1  ORF type:complete len:111 (+),score=29.55 TRINITY_DN3514_c2_g1_i7:533-865(+)